MKKILICVIAISFLGCGKRPKKSVRIDSMKNKGVVIDMSQLTYYQLVIRTDSNIVKELVSHEIFNYININDTIK